MTVGSRLSAAWALLASALVLASCSSSSDEGAAITAFSFAKAENAAALSALGSDAQGVIDPELHTIKVLLDGAVSDYGALVPAIAISGSAEVYPASGEVHDFTQTPVPYKLVDSGGKTTVYYVYFAAKPAPAEAGALRMTEYFCGTGSGTATTGELNRYLELYNDSDAAVDLSQFRLAQRRSRNGVRDSSLDQVVSLKGSIGPKAFYLIYAARINASLLANANAFGAKISDSSYNGIMDSNGASGYQLIRDGAVVDSIGPNDGSFYAKDACYCRRSLAAGQPGPATPSWDRGAWVALPVGGLLGDDVNAGKASPIGSALLSLVASNGSLHMAATVDETGKTATILLPEGVDRAALDLNVGSFGVSVTIGGIPVGNGSIHADLSVARQLAITGQDGSKSTYTVSAIARYTTTNYDFDGGIAAVLAKIWAGGSVDTALNGTAITGVVTATGIYPASFSIQDKNAGIYFYTSEGISFPVGSKVRIKVNTGKAYYGLPEITDYDSIESAGSGLNSLYYKTGDYANKDAICCVYRYDGTIAVGGLSYYKGKFDGALYFHYPSGTIEDLLATGSRGTFYGPVTYTRDNYTMEIVTADQFSIR